MQNDTHTGIVGFVIKYKISLVLILILFLLAKQNILVNDFPNVIFQKQKAIENMKLINKQFKVDKSPVYVGGLECIDRIELSQRILEHEISHLLEYIVWNETGDNNKRFKDILAKLWGHKENWHRLR